LQGAILAFSLVGTIVSAVSIAIIAFAFVQMVTGIDCDFVEMVN
jgi:hypothetical protein